MDVSTSKQASAFQGSNRPNDLLILTEKEVSDISLPNQRKVGFSLGSDKLVSDSMLIVKFLKKTLRSRNKRSPITIITTTNGKNEETRLLGDFVGWIMLHLLATS